MNLGNEVRAGVVDGLRDTTWNLGALEERYGT